MLAFNIVYIVFVTPDNTEWRCLDMMFQLLMPSIRIFQN
jgi:hypothetical protein